MLICGPINIFVAAVLCLLGMAIGVRTGQMFLSIAGAMLVGTALAYVCFAAVLFIASRYRHSEVTPEQRLGYGGAVALFLRETVALATLYGYYHLPSLTRRRPGQWKSGRGKRAVILVHGYFCNSGFWLPLMKRLGDKLECAVYAITLEPLWATIDHSADQLAMLIDAAGADGHDGIMLVGHSMGGLVSRCCYQRYAGRDCIQKIITLGSPHHGTWEAYLSRWPNSRQMRPGSPWLEALNAHAIQHPKLTSIYSLHDSVITPQRSSHLEGATNIELAGIGHMEMSRHPKIIEEVLRALEGVGASA